MPDVFLAQLPLLGIVDSIGEAVANAIKGIIDFVVGALLKLVGAALLGLVQEFLAPMLLYTPAVVKDESFVMQNGFIDQSPYITTTIDDFYQRSLIISGGLVGLSVAVSAVMMMLGFLPALRDAARDNFSRLILFAPAAFLAPYILQLIINVNSLLYAIPCPQGPDGCLDMEWGDAFDLNFSAFSGGDMVNVATGLAMIITALALLYSMIYFAARFAVIVLVAAISPLMFVGMAFNFSRPMAAKLFSTFTSAVFYQFFGLVVMKLGLTLMRAAQASP